MQSNRWTGFLLVAITVIVGCMGKKQNKVTNAELKQLTEELFGYEDQIFRSRVQTNFQGQLTGRRFRDVAPQPFLAVDDEIFENPVVKRLRKLFDNYEMDTNQKENVTLEEKEEEERLLDALLETNSINRVINFCSDHGLVGKGNRTHREILRHVWFQQYPRHQNIDVATSSAFEHIFLGELKRGRKLSGLHNWISFNNAERSGDIDYWGYRLKNSLGNTTIPAVVDVAYRYVGHVSATIFFIGTSPELEMSLFTLCYFARPNKYCHLSMNGTDFGIKTYVMNHRGRHAHLATAFPQY
ncbi:endoribonuclease CG2145-like isoform X1 [Neodiprion virginianus]|uniref:endoribonuclease CG2145-like isoform X1 n=2 Tax=Neodiprion virginianus TaxID=2961670 RepID=UPI001EE7295E|nr:endoribonuclease CG2145-like isoform X1 [Neodiprion virginianus]XP_046612542.1 endoribonuclease CG2145-like isoform X1 [Neodiprion virginianus]